MRLEKKIVKDFDLFRIRGNYVWLVHNFKLNDAYSRRAYLYVMCAHNTKLVMVPLRADILVQPSTAERGRHTSYERCTLGS
jgi:hypothetical protein